MKPKKFIETTSLPVSAVFRSGGRFEYLRHLRHVLQHAIGAASAHATGHAAVLGERVPQVVAHHRVVALAIGWPWRGEIGRHLLVGILSVEVVGIDHEEGFMHDLLGREQGMRGAPGLCAAFWHGETFRQVVQILKRVVHGDAAGEAGTDLIFEKLLKVPADHKHHLAEAGADRVKHRVIEHHLPARPHGIELFQAAVTAAHAGSEDEESGFHAWW
jgi:hypothetical protein